MTETDMCNTALGMLGHDRVISGDFRTATSTEAIRCRLHYDAARKSVLSAPTCWIFAEESVTLYCSPDPTQGCVADWRLFAQPPDCLNIVRAHHAHDPDAPLDFNPAGHDVCINCACDEATLVYVRDVKDLAAWPQPVLDALAAELAARLSGAITGSTDKAKAFRQDATRELTKASFWNARQAPQKPTGVNRYVHSRNGQPR
jgi:hypothetical protein